MGSRSIFGYLVAIKTSVGRLIQYADCAPHAYLILMDCSATDSQRVSTKTCSEHQVSSRGMIRYGWTFYIDMANNLIMRLSEVVISYIVTRRFHQFYLHISLTTFSRITREPELQEWVTSIDPEVKAKMPVTHAIALAIDRFYFNHYCKHFRSGAFARANCSMSVLL